MWKLLKISEQPYFICCNLNSIQDVTFILYDLKTTWSQTLTIQDVKKNVKLLNKRFDFNDDNIKEALLSDTIESAVLEEVSDQDSCLLNLKYRVKNCLLTYEWTLRKQNLLDQAFVQPLLLALLGCHEQVEILTDSIRKKDAELKQFRIEGAVLNRKTLVTKPFDFGNFSKKFEDCNKTAINFRELAKYVKENESKEETEVLKKHLDLNKTEDMKPKENFNDHQSVNIKMSPRQRKRKVTERKMQHLEQHLKLRKQGLEYESSQSQATTSGNSQTIEETAIKDLKQQQQRDTTKEPKSEIISPPRRSSRHTPTVQYYMSSEDNSDSDNGHYLRTLSQGKSIRSSVNLPEDPNKNSSNEQAKSNFNNNVIATKQKCVKSLTLSNNSPTKSPKKITANSNVFDFDSEEEGKDAQKNESEKGLRELTRSTKLSTNNSSMLSLTNDSERMISLSPALGCISISPPYQKDLSYSSTPVIINEISSQLDNIRKELETLEAMRLADLEKRTCKV